MQEKLAAKTVWTPPSIVTMEVLYWMPMHPTLLQSFLWQTDDEAPRFPRMRRFLDHWRREIDAVIHSVTLAHNDGKAMQMVKVDADFRLQ